MKKNLRLLVGVAVGAAAFLAFTSCAYDPYYSSSSVGGYYGGGYGDGYGYGGSSFSTSLFVSTGDPRWGYDPNCYSYYDYQRRCYYDPYLNGYYPIGYRPPVIYGCPHPYGWRSGSGYCPPPRGVRNVAVVNYRNRESAYRNSGYGWAGQVRQQPTRSEPSRGQRAEQQRYQTPDRRPSYDSSSSYNRQSYQRESTPQYRADSVVRPQAEQSKRQSQSQSRYNAPVNDYTPPTSQRRQQSERSTSSEMKRPQLGAPGGRHQSSAENQAPQRSHESRRESSNRNSDQGEDKPSRGFR
ncbi:MAG: hypothetical protein ABI600_04290 [Luteolibacter sp.]